MSLLIFRFTFSKFKKSESKPNNQSQSQNKRGYMNNYPRARRDRIVNVRMSEHDHKRLVERAARARAKTPSAYIRAAALTGQEIELPAWDSRCVTS
jgi:hypothetical protein